jgi:hypothetical protein
MKVYQKDKYIITNKERQRFEQYAGIVKNAMEYNIYHDPCEDYDVREIYKKVSKLVIKDIKKLERCSE